jgi:hypothetical protein
LTQFFFDGFRVKDSFVHRTARGLIVPFVIVICVLLAGVGSARAAKNALVEVGFVGVPPPNFQNVLLNVRSVRINPHASAAPGNKSWNNIPVPPGIGGSGRSADLQIDLNTSQNIPQLFNIAGVQPGTYSIAELLLDPDNPGTLVPNCPLAPPLSGANDGCINYPIQLAAGHSVISVTNTGPGGLIQPGNGKLTELVLQVSMTIIQPPTTPGGAYTVAVTLASPPTNPVELGVVKGSVNVKTGSGSGTSPTGKVRKLAVTAEAIGTNTAIASAPVKNGKFTLELPAAGGPAAPGFGTLYDLAVAGGGDTYAAERLLPLYPGQSITADFNGSNSLTGSQTLGNITGTITDNCVATKPIVGATLQLLIPPDSNPTANCFPSGTSPESFLECVAVATANTDNTGYFPLPGTLKVPAEFANVPIGKKKAPYVYVMEVSAPGYDNLFVYAIPGTSKKDGTCSTDGTTFTACKLALNTGYISGTIPIEPPISGQTTLVQVFAEDTGTNNIESALPAPIIVRSSNPGTVGFTLNVPTKPISPATVRTFDLFATTIDLYHGVTDPYQGHTIAVLSDVTGPAEQSGHVCNTVAAPFDQTITCIGHGSITAGPDGVANADLGTSVVLSKGNVQITNTPVQNQSANSNPLNSYSFCIPADTYQVQRLQLPVPSPDATPSVAPTPFLDGSPVTVTIPPAPLVHGPTASPTPTIKCPTTCENSDGSCPGICNDVIQPL